jgi:hypothetical protein
MSSTTSALLSDYFTEKKLAAEIKKSPRTVRKWRREGIGPPVTWIGQTPYYRIVAAREWLVSAEKRSVRDRARRQQTLTRTADLRI